jgi:hypothetical protein
MAVALSIFISRRPHFSQVPPWAVIIGLLSGAITDGLIWFMAGLTLSYIMALFHRRKTRLDLALLAFQSSNLNSSDSRLYKRDGDGL